jgi:hypothetical protein
MASQKTELLEEYLEQTQLYYFSQPGHLSNHGSWPPGLQTMLRNYRIGQKERVCDTCLTIACLFYRNLLHSFIIISIQL